MIYKMTLKDSADEMTFDLLEVPIVDKDIEGAVDNVTLDGNQYTDYLWLKKQFIQKWSILCDDEYTRLRGFYTRQFENADVPSYRLYYGDDIVRNFTESGEYITLSINGVADGTMSLTQIDGNIEQDGTPTPSAPVPVQTVTGRQTVTVTGKNLVDASSMRPATSTTGLAITHESDGSITLNGTLASNYNIRVNATNVIKNLSGKTITLSVATSGTGNWRNFGIKKRSGTDLLIVNRTQGNTKTGSFTDDGSEYMFDLYGNPADGATFSNFNVKLQCELGSTATTFEPYKAQEYEINLGKNLFDKDNPNVVRGYIAGTNLTSGTDYTIYIPCEENTTYTIQKMVAVPQTANRFRINSYATEPTGGSTSISSSYFWNAGDGSATTAHTYTTPAGAKYLGITVMTANTSGTTTADEMYASIQIEKGSTATDYSAYFEPIELCKIVESSTTYQDRIYKENGKWYLRKEIGKITFTPSTAWTKHGTTNGNVFMLSDTGFIGYPYNSGHVAPALMDTDRAIVLGSMPDSANGVFGINSAGANAQLMVFRGTYDANYTADTFKAKMVGHYIYGALATPTTAEITNEEILKGLESLVDEAISVGQHNIYTDTPNALPTLTFDLTEYLSKSTTIIPETAVRLTLADGGVINACGCRKDVQLTMRETIE